ncbi:MAG: hypothetical protein ACYSWQ_12275 [Planctomycetota bacterium]|jgi:hypothetical protein
MTNRDRSTHLTWLRDQTATHLGPLVQSGALAEERFRVSLAQVGGQG